MSIHPSARAALEAPKASFLSLLREATGVAQLPSLLRGVDDLDVPRGDGSVVLVLPGFGAEDWTTWPLRRALAQLGYRPLPWGLGRNVRDVRESVDEIGTKVRGLATREGGPIFLAGWSLGGYIAREVARDNPEDIAHVVTFGSPVIGGPKYTTAASAVARLGYDIDEIEREVEARKSVPLRVPTTAIYSRTDGVVAWQACIDPEDGAPVEHIEVDSTHIGLGLSREIIAIAADRLGAARSR